MTRPLLLWLTAGFALGVVAGCNGCQPEPIACDASRVMCDELCLDVRQDRRNCGACGVECGSSEVCADGGCQACDAPNAVCGKQCVDLTSSLSHCGACGAGCLNGSCDAGGCDCPSELTRCQGGCFDVATTKLHCGACGKRCAANQACLDAGCVTQCSANLTPCGTLCINPSRDRQNCGGCGLACNVTEGCDAGACWVVPDLDGDGYTALTGDCCETTAQCSDPAHVNPAVNEVLGNHVDDNCDGRVDTQNLTDGGVCDDGLAVTPSDARDYARAMDICQGLVSAELALANGAPVSTSRGIGIHSAVGINLPSAGRRVLVLGSGIANSGLGLSPGDNGAATVDLATCGGPGCVQDWLQASNPPLKTTGAFPSAPACLASSNDVHAHDSVMLRLTLKAPSSARSFSFLARFFSEEYPEYVCSPFNDQVVVLTSASGAPADKNLMTYTSAAQAWPIGINVAAGTPLFQACDSQAVNPTCWDPSVSVDSCTEGHGALGGTYFDRAAPPPACTSGGATAQLITKGNVQPGETFELRIAIWDVGDSALDSFVVLDDFQWGDHMVRPGTDGFDAGDR